MQENNILEKARGEIAARQAADQQADGAQGDSDGLAISVRAVKPGVVLLEFADFVQGVRLSPEQARVMAMRLRQNANLIDGGKRNKPTRRQRRKNKSKED